MTSPGLGRSDPQGAVISNLGGGSGLGQCTWSAVVVYSEALERSQWHHFTNEINVAFGSAPYMMPPSESSSDQLPCHLDHHAAGLIRQAARPVDGKGQIQFPQRRNKWEVFLPDLALGQQ